MRAGRRHTALLILATLIQAGRLLAATPSDGTGHVTDRVRRMLLASLVERQRTGAAGRAAGRLAGPVGQPRPP